jgi:hypothetical protein
VSKKKRAFIDECFYAELRRDCFKLRGLCHLFENQRNDQAVGLDSGEVWYGIGLFLSEIHDDVLRISQALEDEEIKEARETKSKNE